MEDKIIEIKKELLEKAKTLAEDENAINILTEVNALKKKWKTREEEESLLESEMKEEFDSYLDKIYTKLGKVSMNVEDTKLEIISRAKEVLNEKNFKQATAKMNDLFNEWKAAGRTSSKEKDDELWTEFKTIKDEFNDKKNKYFEELKANFAKNKTAKEEIIEKAIKANEGTNIKEISNTMNSLMDEWKKLTSAGRKEDEELWKKFSEQRKVFNSKRKEYYDSMKEVFEQRTNDKKELIIKAKQCLAKSEFTAEEVDSVKKLREEWKKIGNAGKDNENDLWNEFNRIITKYFDNKKYYD